MSLVQRTPDICHIHSWSGSAKKARLSFVVDGTLTLLMKYKVLLMRYWGQPLWARGYLVASSVNVTNEAWKACIEIQRPPEPDDGFLVVWRQQSAEQRPTDPAFSRNLKPPTLALSLIHI